MDFDHERTVGLSKRNHLQEGRMHLKANWPVLLSMAAFASTGAWQPIFKCATTRQPAEAHLRPRHLNNDYDDLSAQQQAILSSGKLSPNDYVSGGNRPETPDTDVHALIRYSQGEGVGRSAEAVLPAAQARQWLHPLTWLPSVRAEVVPLSHLSLPNVGGFSCSPGGVPLA